ncbi:MAG: peptidyl-prolyl cis-trans isomerase [Clostridiales bacterium]|nr:peptidyl-prolyl cis-trans isomerase [Clostridiales bacterium]
MRKKKTLFLVLICLACVLLSGCRIGDTEIILQWQNPKPKTDHRYIFQINDEKCDVRQAKIYLCNYRNIYGDAYGIDLWEYDFGDDSLEEYVKDVTIQELSRIVCMNLLAAQMGMSLDENEQTLAAQAAQDYFDSLSEYEKTFMDVKESDIEKAYDEYALAKKLYASLTEGIDEEVSDDEARVIRVQQIYVTDEETAMTVQDKLDEGDDFAAVASTYNEASEIETTVARDDYPQEVENIAFNLDNGAVSEMIEADDGYYFIKCLSKLEEQLTEDNKDNIRQKRRMEQFDAAYMEFTESATFQMNDELWDEVSLEDTDQITTDSFFTTYTKYFGE